MPSLLVFPFTLRSLFNPCDTFITHVRLIKKLTTIMTNISKANTARHATRTRYSRVSRHLLLLLHLLLLPYPLVCPLGDKYLAYNARRCCWANTLINFFHEHLGLEPDSSDSDSTATSLLSQSNPHQLSDLAYLLGLFALRVARLCLSM